MTTTTMEDTVSASTTRSALVAHIEQQSRWRCDVDHRFPGDPRNIEWAHRLQGFANYVAALPNTDERLREIDQVWGMFGPPEYLVSGDPEYDSLLSKPDLVDGSEWLDRFVATYSKVEVDSWVDGVGMESLVDDAQDREPAIALPAIRRLRYLVEQAEETAVLRATAEGWPWSRIAQNLGKSTQTVWKKHRDPQESMVTVPHAAGTEPKDALTESPFREMIGARSWEQGETRSAGPGVEETDFTIWN